MKQVYDIEVAKCSALFFTKSIVTHCEEESETLGLLQHNKYGIGKGREIINMTTLERLRIGTTFVNNVTVALSYSGKLKETTIISQISIWSPIIGNSGKL